jgi:RNA polymerase sigma-70 factor (ECF subfamily)
MLPPDDTGTTAAVQQYLGALAGPHVDSPADPIIRALLARAVGRLHMLCTTLLHQS